MFDDADDIDTVVFVVSDSLRADMAREWMPYLQTLGDEHVRCPSCYAVGPHTPSSMTGIVQSRLPIDGGYGTTLPQSPPTIAETLSADGVACAGWHCNPHTLAERDFHRGFGVYADLIEEGPLNDPHERTDSNGSSSSNLRYRIRELADTVGVRPVVDALAEQLKRRGYLTVDPRVPASQTVDAFETWLARRDPDRRFAYLHLMDTHMPYRPPATHWEHSEIERISAGRAQKLYQRLSDDDYDLDETELADLRRLYAAEAEYVDRELERLVSSLEERELWDSTLLVVTSDHGELFGERASPDGTDTGHPSYLCPELVQVPLVLAGGAVPSASIDQLVSGLDIAPTIAAALGVAPADEWQGQPVSSAERDEILSTVASDPDYADKVDPEWLHVAVWTDDRALLWWRNSTGTEYYQRADGTETRVSKPEPRLYESELESARSYRDASVAHSAGESDPTVNKQRLRDLGYID